MVEFYYGDPIPGKGFISLYISQVRGFFCSATLSCPSNMHSFTFTLLAVLSYVAVIGATPLGNRAPAEAINRRQNPGCFIDPALPDCGQYCSTNPNSKTCSGYCATNLNILRPECQVCVRSPRLSISICTGVCDSVPQIPACQASSSTSD